MRPNIYPEIRPSFRPRASVFPLLNSFYATRAILSYLTPLELQTVVSFLNKWCYSYMKLNKNPHLIYGRSDFGLSTVYKCVEDNNVYIKSINLNNNSIVTSLITTFPKEFTMFKSIEDSKNHIYIIGGYDSNIESVVSFSFKYESGQLTREEPMRSPRTSFSLLIFGSSLLVIGGFYFGTSAVFERYSFITKQWTKEASLNISRCLPILAEFNYNCIYAFGGTDGHTPLNSIERYLDNKWELLPPVSQSHYAVSRIGGYAHQISKNHILIFGGKNPLYKNHVGQCFVFNVTSKAFTGNIEMFEESFKDIGVFMCKSKLYTLGSTAQCFDCKKGLWRLLKEKIYP